MNWLILLEKMKVKQMEKKNIKLNKWTEFMDMRSGGGLKEKFAYCFIEAPEEEAKVIFYNRFGHSASRITCPFLVVEKIIRFMDIVL